MTDGRLTRGVRNIFFIVFCNESTCANHQVNSAAIDLQVVNGFILFVCVSDKIKASSNCKSHNLTQNKAHAVFVRK